MRTVLKDYWWRSGGAAEHAGTTLYKEQPLYLNFNKQTEEDEEEIESNITNLGTMELTIEPVNSPILSQRLSGKSFIDYGLSSFNLNNDGTGLFDRSFFVDLLVSGEDGINAEGIQILGARISSGKEVNLFIDNNGYLTLNWGYGGSRFVYKSSATVVPNAPFGSVAISIDVNFEDDTCAIYKNGTLVAGSFTTGNISTFTPSNWDNTYDVYIGVLNVAGVLSSSNNTKSYFYKVAVGGTRTAAERALMLESLTTDWS